MSMNEPNASSEDLKKLKNLVTLVYLLQAATIGLFFTYLIAPLVILWFRKRVRGTWLESHLRWQLNTFWFSLAGLVTGIPILPHPAGLIILSATSLWFVFRIIQGWTRLSRNQAMSIAGSR